jgi:phage terminase large subunit-like protein
MSPIHRMVHLNNDTVLWKARRSEADVLDIKATTQDYIWQTTYQGQPTAPKGQIFQREWWAGKNRFDWSMDGIIATYVSADTGLSDTETSAMSALVVLGLDSHYRVRVLDVIANRVQYPQLVTMTNQTAVKYNEKELLHGIIIENKASGISLLQTMKQSSPDKIVQLLKPYNPKIAKELRWGESAVWCGLDTVLLPNPSPACPWLYEFERDLFEAPDVELKDRLDAFAQGINFLSHYLSSGYSSRTQGRS